MKKKNTAIVLIYNSVLTDFNICRKERIASIVIHIYFYYSLRGFDLISIKVTSEKLKKKMFAVNKDYCWEKMLI